MSDYDSPWKEALDVFFEPFLELFFTEAHADIDWSRGTEPLDKELQQIVREAEVGRRFVDKLVKVWLKSGQEQWVLVHVEVQASEDADFGLRMYVYNYRLFDRYNREVASFAVLGRRQPSLAARQFQLSPLGRGGRDSVSDRQAAGLCGQAAGVGRKPKSFRHRHFGSFGHLGNASG